MPKGIPKKVRLQILLDQYGTGSLEHIQAALHFSIIKAVELIDSDDVKTQLSGHHALATAAGKYFKAIEMVEMGERIDSLEAKLEELLNRGQGS